MSKLGTIATAVSFICAASPLECIADANVVFHYTSEDILDLDGQVWTLPSQVNQVYQIPYVRTYGIGEGDAAVTWHASEYNSAAGEGTFLYPKGSLARNQRVLGSPPVPGASAIQGYLNGVGLLINSFTSPVGAPPIQGATVNRTWDIVGAQDPAPDPFALSPSPRVCVSYRLAVPVSVTGHGPSGSANQSYASIRFAEKLNFYDQVLVIVQAYRSNPPVFEYADPSSGGFYSSYFDSTTTKVTSIERSATTQIAPWGDDRLFGFCISELQFGEIVSALNRPRLSVNPDDYELNEVAIGGELWLGGFSVPQDPPSANNGYMTIRVRDIYVYTEYGD